MSSNALNNSANNLNNINATNATRNFDTTTLRIEHWVKTLLIQWFVKDGDWVCEVFPGAGLDLGKWQRANVGHYTIIEPNKQNLKQLYKACLSKAFKNFPLIVQTELTEKLLPFDRHPSHLPLITSFRSKTHDDAQLNILPKALNEPHHNKYQMVASFQGFEGAFQTEQQLKYFVANVAQLLKVGGYFAGIMTDSANIFTKAHKKTSASKVISSEGFELHMPFDSAVESFQERISSLPFVLKFRESATDNKELRSNLFLVHCPTFIRICREMGLDLIEIQNIQDFYEENRKVHETTLKKCLAGSKPKSVHLSRLNLFASFIFQKIIDIPLNELMIRVHDNEKKRVDDSQSNVNNREDEHMSDHSPIHIRVHTDQEDGEISIEHIGNVTEESTLDNPSYDQHSDLSSNSIKQFENTQTDQANFIINNQVDENVGETAHSQNESTSVSSVTQTPIEDNDFIKLDNSTTGQQDENMAEAEQQIEENDDNGAEMEE